jgi:uncharacterized RDD family membrane protein YckC
MNYSDYRPVGGGQRLLVLIGNLFLCAIAANGLIYVGEYAGLSEKELLVFYTLSLIGAVILFSMYPESPCKRLGRLKILSNEREETEFKKRILRASPYLVLLLTMLLFPLFSEDPKEKVVVNGIISISYILTVFFIFANGLCAFFHPEKKSLMDMKLGTQVMKPPPIPEHIKPRVFGRKII